MRPLNNIEEENLKTFTENSVSVALIEPTKTGLNKSILDATFPVREYLKERKIHDYLLQNQGPDNKILVEAVLLDGVEAIQSKASLYRPNTKKGDPRIWFRKLKTIASPNDILAIIARARKLYVVNISKTLIKENYLNDKNNPIAKLFSIIKNKENEIAKELLCLLKDLAASGPIPAIVNADTAVGRTLEKALGIEMNSSKTPDYKGIELKAFRDKRNNRKTLFTQVPDWKISKFKSSRQILETFGYKVGDQYKLNCTVSTLKKNSQGLQLRIETDINRLFEYSHRIDINDFAIWPLSNLHKRLKEKHNETFWIEAKSTFVKGREYFLYTVAEHTKKPIVSQFDVLIEQGVITLDHMIKKNAKGRVSERGPSFKLAKNALGLLFPPSEVYHLL